MGVQSFLSQKVAGAQVNKLKTFFDFIALSSFSRTWTSQNKNYQWFNLHKCNVLILQILNMTQIYSKIKLKNIHQKPNVDRFTICTNVKDFLFFNITFVENVIKIQMMKKVDTPDNHLKKRYLCYINGPILFTAPHSKKLMRGGPEYGENKRVHLREIYTSYLASQLAHLTGKNSFCIWGKSASINQEEMDPNYLLPKMFQKNPFHQSLQYWALKNQGKPILHVDIHGKINRKNNCQIDVGVMSLEVHWGDEKVIKLMKSYFEKEISKVFEGLQFLGFECKINTDPCLHGYWGEGMCTMTQQAALLNIPSFQLQIPRAVRQKLFKDLKLLQSFGKGIKSLYQGIIIPWNKSRELRVQKRFLDVFKVTIQNEKQKEECLNQLMIFQKKEESNLNVKYI